MNPAEVEREGSRPEQPPAGEALSVHPASDELSWLAQFQRVSGLVLIPLAALVFVHTYLANDVAGIRAIDAERRWSNPLLQLVDWSFVALALVHGLVGWHWYLHRHVASSTVRWVIEGVSMSVIALAFAYGSLAIFAA